MHELSIAISLLDVAVEEAARRGIDVVAIHVKIGPLSGVVPEALLAAFELARETTPLSHARLAIEETPVRVVCPTCRGERAVAAPHDLRCADCGTATPDIVSGRELDIVALETP